MPWNFITFSSCSLAMCGCHILQQGVLKLWCLPPAQVKAKLQAFLAANPWYANIYGIYDTFPGVTTESVLRLPLDVMLKLSSFAIHNGEDNTGSPISFANDERGSSPAASGAPPLPSQIPRPDRKEVRFHSSLNE